MAMLSPGVQVVEIDASAIVPTVSNAVAVFGGSFTKGPCDTYKLISNSVELEGFYGKPTNTNYNEWYQCKTFLDYGNLLLVSRGLSASAKNAITLVGATTATATLDAAAIAASNTTVISNADDFAVSEASITFPVDAAADIALKIISQNPGIWGNSVKVAIAAPADFGLSKYAFNGIVLDEQFEYAPVTGEYGILVQVDGEVVERYVVSFDEAAKDFNNKSIYIENLINSQSKYIFVKDNTAVTGLMTAGTELKSQLYSNTTDKDLTLIDGNDGATLTSGEIEAAYTIFANKEELDIDIVIANENAPVPAFNLAEARKDCIAFIGATYADTVGKKPADALTALTTWRQTGAMNINSSYAVVGANYLNVYDKYADKYRWINCAGSIAGLRAQTNTDRDSWYLSLPR